MRTIRTIRTATALIMIMALGILLGGCAQQQSRESAGTIGIAMPSKTIERWSRDGEYLKKSFEAHGYDVELRYSDDDINHQINDIQVLIADDVDLLLIVAIDGSALFRTLEDAEFKHIPVIAYDRLIMNTDAVNCYVSFDNYRVGALQAQFIEERLGLNDSGDSDESFNIELVAGDPADNNAIYYYNGARDVLQPYLDSGKLKIPSRKLEFLQTCTPGWSTDEAYENMQNILASYYSDKTRLDAVLCASDALSLGVIPALYSDYAGDNIPVVTGQDGDIATLQAIVDGRQTMTIYKNVNNEADIAVEVADAMLKGKPLDASLTGELSAECVFDDTSYDNGTKVVPSYLLIPEVITLENLDSLAATGLYKWDERHRYMVAN